MAKKRGLTEDKGHPHVATVVTSHTFRMLHQQVYSAEVEQVSYLEIQST